MEGNSWRPAQGEPPSMPDASAGDWRSQLQPEARQRIVNKIMETLKRHLPISVPEGLNELQKIAFRFEDKIYSAAANQSDYLRKISLKMLSMESKSQHPGGPGQINPSINQNPVDPVNPSSTRQQLQNMQHNSSIGSQSTSSLPSALSSIPGLSQPTISSVSQSSSLNMTGISQNSISNSLGQAAATDIYSTAQRQIQGRQQQQMISQQQHQSQNQFVYQQQQLQQQLLKQKLQQSPFSQSHVQQQSLLQQTPQLQSSQQPLLPIASNLQSGQSGIQQTQSGAIQSAVQSGLSQNSLNSVQQSGQSLLQQHPQPVSRQQQQSQSNILQQTPLQQQQTSAPQHSNLSMQPHQQLMGQQSNISNVQQSQLVGQQTSVTEMQQQPQRMPTQQNNLLSMQQSQHLLNQQSMSLHQQQVLGSQTNISGLSQQQQQQQQQQQILVASSNVSNMQPHQRPMHILQQAKTAVQQQQQNQQAPLAMLQAQGQPQNQSLQQQQISHIQSQSAPLQQQLVQQHMSSLQRDMQQRVPASGSLLSQNAIEHQKQFGQSQIGIPEVSSSSTLDSIAPTGHVAIADLQEEIYQKIRSMKDLYFADLHELHRRICLKLQQNDALPSAKAAEQFEETKSFKMILERILQILQLSKANIKPSLKDKIPMFEKKIQNIILSAKNKKIIPSQAPGQQRFQHPSSYSQLVQQQQQTQRFQHPSSHSQLVQQQQQTQVSRLQQHDNYANQQNNIQATLVDSIAPTGEDADAIEDPISLILQQHWWFQ